MPRWHPSLPVVLTRFGVGFSELPRRTTLGLDPAVKQLDSQMKKFAEEHGANFISPYTILCDMNGCLTRVGDRVESMMHWDVSHLTQAGSEYLASAFAAMMRRKHNLFPGIIRYQVAPSLRDSSKMSLYTSLISTLSFPSLAH